MPSLMIKRSFGLRCLRHDKILRSFRFRWIAPNAGFGGDGVKAKVVADDHTEEKKGMTTANEIADKIAAELSMTKAQTKTMVDSVFQTDRRLNGSGDQYSRL